MKRISSKPSRANQRVLAAGIASALALAAPAAFAVPNVWPVQNCNDTGAGSLRDVLTAPTTLSGDTVDLTARTDCVNSTISLQLGELTVSQTSLTILGPGSDKLTIDGTDLPTGNTYQNNSRLLTHTGGGTLDIHGLTLSGGHIYHTGNGYNALGGCLYSAKDLVLESVDVRNCSAQSLQGKAYGGGVYAKGSATLDNVTLFGNTAAGSTVRGGGIAALGKITATGGLAKNNSALGGGIVLGGGISARGGVSLDGTAVVHNTGSSAAAFAQGGGIYTRYDLTLKNATISGNTAKMSDGGNAGAGAGGAASFFGPVSISYSTIADNAANGIPTNSIAGGVSTLGDFRMDHSTVSGNTTSGSIGGIFKTENCGGCTQTFYMRNSTVSGNHADLTVGGVDIGAAQQIKLLNSTIAFNTAGKGQGGGPGNYFPAGAGLQLYGGTPTTVSMHSMLISNNTYGAGNVASDFTTASAQTITFTDGPSNSLIFQTSAPNLPTGVTVGACPLLGPLRNNGGLTRTHALSRTSPAIDAGDNVIGGIVITLNLNDQRGNEMGNGTATYLRASGLLPDIGAYEVQQDDEIHNAGFDGCPDIP